jgi:hypothetical protein
VNKGHVKEKPYMAFKEKWSLFGVYSAVLLSVKVCPSVVIINTVVFIGWLAK